MLPLARTTRVASFCAVCCGFAMACAGIRDGTDSHCYATWFVAFLLMRAGFFACRELFGRLLRARRARTFLCRDVATLSSSLLQFWFGRRDEKNDGGRHLPAGVAKLVCGGLRACGRTGAARWRRACWAGCRVTAWPSNVANSATPANAGGAERGLLLLLPLPAFSLFRAGHVCGCLLVTVAAACANMVMCCTPYRPSGAFAAGTPVGPSRGILRLYLALCENPCQ